MPRGPILARVIQRPRDALGIVAERLRAQHDLLDVRAMLVL